MKSIKEKAKEHGLEYPVIRCSNDDIYKDCDKPSMDFVEGANYVLEQIEKLVKFNRWAAQDLYKLIKQLKKQGYGNKRRNNGVYGICNILSCCLYSFGLLCKI